MSGIYSILPSQTLTSILQEEGLTKTEIIHYEWGEFTPMNRELLIISQNEKATVLSSARFSPSSGWNPGSKAHVFMRGEEKDHHFAWTARNQSERDKQWVCLFGFVPIGEAAPAYQIGVADWNWPLDGNAYYQSEEEYVVLDDKYFLEAPVTVTPTPTIPVRGGMLYLEQYPVDLEKFDYEECDVEVLMERGGVWDDPPRWSSSHMTR